MQFQAIIELFAHPFAKGFISRAGEKGSIVIRFMSEFRAIFFPGSVLDKSDYELNNVFFLFAVK